MTSLLLVPSLVSTFTVRRTNSDNTQQHSTIHTSNTADQTVSTSRQMWAQLNQNASHGMVSKFSRIELTHFKSISQVEFMRNSMLHFILTLQSTSPNVVSFYLSIYFALLQFSSVVSWRNGIFLRCHSNSLAAIQSRLSPLVVDDATTTTHTHLIRLHNLQQQHSLTHSYSHALYYSTHHEIESPDTTRRDRRRRFALTSSHTLTVLVMMTSRNTPQGRTARQTKTSAM